MELTLVVRQEGAEYWSEIEQLPGCFASGRTLEELGEALDEAIALYLDGEPGEFSRGALRVGAQSASVLRPQRP